MQRHCPPVTSTLGVSVLTPKQDSFSTALQSTAEAVSGVHEEYVEFGNQKCREASVESGTAGTGGANRSADCFVHNK